MSTPSTYDITESTLDDTFTINGKSAPATYKARTPPGTSSSAVTRRSLQMKEQFPFVDGNGDEVFEVNAGGIIAWPASTSSPTCWRRSLSPHNDLLFRTCGRFGTPARRRRSRYRARSDETDEYVRHGRVILHKYEITDRTAPTSATSTEFSRKTARDHHRLRQHGPEGAVIAAAMVIDAIQGN